MSNDAFQCGSFKVKWRMSSDAITNKAKWRVSRNANTDKVKWRMSSNTDKDKISKAPKSQPVNKKC